MNPTNPSTLVDDIQRKQTALRTMRDPDVAAAIETFSDGREWNAIQIATETRHWMGVASSAYVQVCKRVAWAHAVLPKALWLSWAGEDVGLGRAAAYMCLKVAHKVIANGASLERLLTMSQTKVFELANALDPDELKSLADGEEVKGVGAFDEVDKLTTRELQKRLRTKRDDLDTTQLKLAEVEKELKQSREKVGELTIGMGEAEAELKRLRQIRGDFQLAFAKAKTLVSQLNLNPAVEVRAELAALVAMNDVLAAELRTELDFMGLEPREFIATSDDGDLDAPRSARSAPVSFSPDADELLGHLMDPEVLGVLKGEEFVVDALDGKVPGWSRPKLVQTLSELVATRHVLLGIESGTYVFNHEIPDHRPGWLKEQLDRAEKAATDLNSAADLIEFPGGRSDA